MNNHSKTFSPDWIEQMLYYAEQLNVGAVGGVLTYPDHTVEYAGVVLGTADLLLGGGPWNTDGSLSCAREVSAVTAARMVMVMPRDLYEAVGGFNKHFFDAYQDVDLRKFEKSRNELFGHPGSIIRQESTSRGAHHDHVDCHLLPDYLEPMIEAGGPDFHVQSCDFRLN